MPFFHNCGIDFHYNSMGSGPTVVLCHGLTGDLGAPQALVGELPGHRLIVVDARAHGLTQPLGAESDLNFAQFARDLRALLDHLEIDRAVVGGISMGAAIATRFAIDAPERVRGLVLIRPAWLDTPYPANLEPLVLAARLFEKHGPVHWQDIFERQRLFQVVQAREPELIELLRHQFDTPQKIERRARLTRIPGDCPLKVWREVFNLRSPAVVIGSENDWLHPIEIADTWASRLPNSTLRVAATKCRDFQQHACDVRAHLREFFNSL